MADDQTPARSGRNTSRVSLRILGALMGALVVTGATAEITTERAEQSATALATQMGQMDSAIAFESKRLLLEQSRAATTAYLKALSKGSTTMPTIVSLYTSGTGMRALLDTQGSGLRDVGPGDVLADDLVVDSITSARGVAVAVGGINAKKKPLYYLSMKPASTPGLGSFPGQGTGLAGVNTPPHGAGLPGGPTGGQNVAMPIPFVQQPQMPSPVLQR